MTLGVEKLTSHPWPQRCPTDMRECLKRFEKRWAWFAAGGIPGSASMAVWVDSMMLPSGNVTDKGRISFSLWMHGASKARKFPVAPESNMAEFLKLLGGVELR
jgi:hypothetical protein